MRSLSGGRSDPRTKLRLAIEAPFSLEKTVRALQRLPNNQIEVWEDDTYFRLLRIEGQDVPLRITQPEPAFVEVAAAAGSLAPELAGRVGERVRWMLGLEADLAPFRARAAAYPELARLVDQLAGMRPPRFPSLWEVLINGVLFQQISLAVGVTLLNRLAVEFGVRKEAAGRVFLRLPTPAEILQQSEAELRALSLSGAKARSLLSLAAAIESGELDAERLDALPDAELERELVRQRGIGPWTAQIVMLRGLGRLTVFPAGDSGASRALRTFFQWPEPEAPARTAALLEALGDQRGYLYFCMLGWRLLRLGVLGNRSRSD